MRLLVYGLAALALTKRHFPTLREAVTAFQNEVR